VAAVQYIPAVEIRPRWLIARHDTEPQNSIPLEGILAIFACKTGAYYLYFADNLISRNRDCAQYIELVIFGNAPFAYPITN
jgi:hypothetical protein